MSISVARAEGATVLSLTFDPQSSCPPLCQIIKSLCYSPMCCSVSQRLRTVQNTSQSVLGALHIMVGLLNLGLGLMNGGSGSSWEIDESMYPVWLAVLFIVFGISCILSEICPSLCWVTVNMFMNTAGIAFAILLYSIDLVMVNMWWMCRDYTYHNYGYAVSPQHSNDAEMQRKCQEARYLVLLLIKGIYGVLIMLLVLELCVTISSVVLGIKALRSKERNKDEIQDDPEINPSSVKSAPSEMKKPESPVWALT